MEADREGMRTFWVLELNGEHRATLHSSYHRLVRILFVTSDTQTSLGGGEKEVAAGR